MSKDQRKIAFKIAIATFIGALLAIPMKVIMIVLFPLKSLPIISNIFSFSIGVTGMYGMREIN